MSFFDDDDDQPTRVTRPQRQPSEPRAATASQRSGGGGGGGDQQLLVRRAIAAGVGILVLLLLVLGIKSCVDSSNESAMKDYNRSVASIMSSSDQEVAKPLFQALASGTAGNDLQVQINQLRLVADENVKRAKALDVPGDMEKAQQYLLLVLNLRSAALAKIADQIPSATSTKGDPTAAVNKIAGQMQAFNASDVVYSQRVQPYMAQAFDDNGIGGQVIPPSRSLTNLGWMSPQFVADALGASVTATGDGGTTGKAATPGTHGHGLTSVSVGGTDLQPPPAVNRPSDTPPVTFDVKFANQGENDETRVNVIVTVSGTGFTTITAKKTVDQTKAGTDAEASIPLATAPPKGKPVKVTVEIQPVPGEVNTDNNKQSYDASFQ